MNYHRIPIQKAVIFLTSEEISKLLLSNQELYRIGLERGKAFKRAESKKRQYEQKLGKAEAELLNDFMQ